MSNFAKTVIWLGMVVLSWTVVYVAVNVIIFALTSIRAILHFEERWDDRLILKL